MSALESVRTMDGAVWERRAETRGGLALYAVQGSPKCCPPFVMATLDELAEHGIQSPELAAAVELMGALPMPAGSEPQSLPADADRAKAPWGRGEDGRPRLPMGAHWTDVPELVDQYLAGIQARVDGAQSGNWYVASTVETWRAPGTVCTRVDGYHRTVGQFTNVSDADLELVLHAHSDLSWCLDMVAKLRARVAELEVERHSTNEALDDAVQALRADRAEPAKGPSAAESADKLTRLFAPTQALREDKPAAVCRCDEPGADPYSCEADDCCGQFSELNPFGGARPVNEPSAEVSRRCLCGWRTTVWHVDDGSAEEELHGHVTRVHGGTAPNQAPRDVPELGGAK